MSSTTSSDCESCDCSKCTYSFENNHNDNGKLLLNSRHVPMYATMAHPLIYYSEVQHPLNGRATTKRAYDQPRKENPFKKAFKWYTQERTLCNKNDVAPERSGFANWLDNKYVEYLRESGQQSKEPPTSFKHRTRRTAIAESCPPCPASTKIFGRFKSPWRKRRRFGNDSGDVAKKCPDGSCDFLLQPKEMMRAASDTCYHTPTSVGKSNSTVDSLNLLCNTKCSGRSHSLSDVAREKSVLKHGDTVPHAVQECPNCQEQAPTKLATTSGACHQKQGRAKLLISMHVQEQGPSKEQYTTNQPTTLCKCPQDQVVKVSSKEQNASNQLRPLCKCPQKKKSELLKVTSNEQNASNQLVPLCKYLQKKVSEILKVPSKEHDATIQAGQCCKFLQEKKTDVEQVPTKEPYPTNQQTPLLEEVPKAVKVLSIKQDSTNQLNPLQEKVPKVPSKVQDPTNQLNPLREKVPKVPSKVQDPTNQLKLLQEKVPKVPSKVQNPTNQLGLCCKCNLEKVPKVVQVPSQSRAVEESSQYPEEKIAPVHEETQYEPIPESPRNTQNLGPCSCKTCNKQIPPLPQLLCIPVKVQTNKIATSEMCLVIAPTQIDAAKKHKAKRLNVSCQSDEGNKSKVENHSQQQLEPSACCKETAPCQNNCHEVTQVFGPIPIRRQSYSTVAMNEETGECSMVKEVSVVNKFTRSVTCASNDATQTSDHSIRFEKDACSCQYPLFFQIINADITKNE